MKQTGLVFIALLICQASFGQFNLNNFSNQHSNQSGDSKQGVQNKFFYGGGGGLGFGTGYNYYSLFPLVGYRLTNQFSVGSGFTYQRYNYTIPNNFSLTQYGLSPFAMYHFNSLFFQSELDLINAPAYNNNNELVYSLHTRLLFGVGYRIPMGRRSALNALIMYDVLYRLPSVFSSPVVARVFFTF